MNPAGDFYTSLNWLVYFGIASGLLSTVAYIPYIRDTLSGRTQPQRASWLIWSVLGSIAFFSQIYEGASESLWFAGVQVSGTIIVLLLSIRRGIGRFLSRSDYAILATAALGLVLWYYTENAVYALAITISISLLGGLATAIKAYHDPQSETLSTWVISFIASACAIVSVGKADPVLLAYPVYLLMLYLAFILAISLGKLKRAVRVPYGRRRSPGTTTIHNAITGMANTVVACTAVVYLINTSPTLLNPLQPLRLISASLQEAPKEIIEFSPQPLVAEFELPDVEPLRTKIDDPVQTSLTLAPPLDGSAFLQLDRDDPFNSLTVITATASLYPLDSSLTEPMRIQQGTLLIAQATDGEWFKVSPSNGVSGYLHRSQIKINTPDVVTRNL